MDACRMGRRLPGVKGAVTGESSFRPWHLEVL